MFAIANADEILQEAKNWINEESKHNNFETYARGKIRYSFSGRDYSADVIVGIDSKGETTLYDIVNIKGIQINKNRYPKLVATLDKGAPAHGIPANNTIQQTNAKSQDNSYSRAMDDEYMAAVKAGDMEKAQEMVDEAAKKAGYKEIGYHGTNAEPFYVFDPDRPYHRFGAYFSSNENLWPSYGKRLLKAYLNPGKQKVVDLKGGGIAMAHSDLFADIEFRYGAEGELLRILQKNKISPLSVVIVLIVHLFQITFIYALGCAVFIRGDEVTIIVM